MNKKHRLPLGARRLVALLVVVALAAGIVFVVRGFLGWILPSTDAGVQLAISAEATVQTFGDKVLAFDGDEIRCFDIAGVEKWHWPFPVGSKFVSGGDDIIIWKDRVIAMLNALGTQEFSYEVESEIVDVRVTTDYLAVQLHAAPDTLIITYDKNFTEVDRETFTNQRVLDFGFFGQQTNMLWTMALDTTGRLPVTYVATYQPGKTINGYVAISDQLLYKVMFYGGEITLVGSEHILATDYTESTIDSAKTKLIYGWYLMDSLATDSGNIMVFAPSPEPGAPIAIGDLRVFRGGQESAIRLATPVSQILCSNDYIFGFNSAIISVYDYNGKPVQTALNPLTTRLKPL